jgi:hypothetical protein
MALLMVHEPDAAESIHDDRVGLARENANVEAP